MSANPAVARRGTRAFDRGFTLTELMSSLTAGLIIAGAVVSLSRSASETFHEEGRTLTAQAGSRQAMEQLSLDLMRAGYMSTGNIQADPFVARPPGVLMNDVIPSQYVGLRRLAGVRLIVGGSKAATDPQSTNAGLNPDTIELGGNFTTADQYAVREIAATSGGCQRIWLQADSPAMWRLTMTTAGTDANLLINAFKPGPTTSTRQFMVRIQDTTGRVQYAPTCGTSSAVGIASSFPYVDVAQNSYLVGVLTAAQTGTAGGSSGYGAGMLINPVQIVRWSITNAPPANSVAAMTPKTDASKFYLLREVLDALGASDSTTTQVVSEYPVDLKFALTVETGDSTAVNTAHTIFAFEDSANATWSYDVSGVAPSSTGPQRIRSVRVRLATRAPSPDREVALAVTPAGPEGQKFIYRYCTAAVAGKCTDGSRSHARVRTLTNEVALTNQSRWFY
jgi:prepilin-type N-terminal cleavage/methylation domain-containing protein